MNCRVLASLQPDSGKAASQWRLTLTCSYIHIHSFRRPGLILNNPCHLKFSRPPPLPTPHYSLPFYIPCGPMPTLSLPVPTNTIITYAASCIAGGSLAALGYSRGLVRTASEATLRTLLSLLCSLGPELCIYVLRQISSKTIHH